MKPIDPLFAYLVILAIIQPARIQDIETYSSQFFGKNYSQYLIDGRHLRAAHEKAKAMSMVLQVRRGVYFTSPKAKHLVRSAGLERSIDNRRFFLMKAQRKRYK